MQAKLYSLLTCCKSEFVPSRTRACSFWKFERTNMVNAEDSNGYYRSWCIRQEFLCEQRLSLVFFEKERFSPGKSHGNVNLKVIFSMNIWYMQLAGIVNYNFLVRLPNQTLERCFHPLEVISSFVNEMILTFFVTHNALVTFLLHNLTVLSDSTHFKTLKSAKLFPKALI